MKAIVDYFKANARDCWGVISVRQMMKDTLCESEEIEHTIQELQKSGWMFTNSTVRVGGVDYSMIEFEIN